MIAGVASVEAATVSLQPQAVYNLEVAGQHVYQIGFSGVLVHNNGQNYEELADAAKSSAPNSVVADSGTFLSRVPPGHRAVLDDVLAQSDLHLGF